jgi:hypothetical protein
MKRIAFILIIAFVLSGMAINADSAPKPVSVQRAGQWTLDVQYSQPLQIAVSIPGQPMPQRFWYIILTMTNNAAKEEVSLIPSCELVTDTFKTIPAGKNVPKEVFEQIKAKHEGQYPFLESMDFPDLRIRRGADNARDIAIIWPEFDPKANLVNLFIAGLSNEATVINDPIKKDDTGNPVKVYLQKTLQLNYLNATDPTLREQAGLTFQKQSWVMR